MFQRSGAIASIRPASYQQLHAATITDLEMPDSISLTSQGAKSTLTKKLLLTLFVLFQVCFISCLWLLQLGGDLNTSIDEVTVQSTKTLAVSNNVKNMSLIGELHAMRRVNFVRKSSTYKPNEKSTRKEFSTHALSPAVIKNSQSGNVSNFRKDFYLKLNRLNTSIEFRNRNGLVPELDNDTLWCFREGSIDEKSQSPNIDVEQDLAISWEEENMQCKCRAGWHGRDCGQPEVMWRALLTTKSHFKLQKPSEKRNPNKLVYLLEGNFFNLDLLDLQISTLADIVDYFVIHIRPEQKDLKQLKRLLKETLKTDNYFIFHCGQKFALKNENCTIQYVYRYFRQQLKNRKLHFFTPLKPTDLLLYTDDRVLPSRQALKFLKYYATDVSITPFRLKYVVYGFYWLHPKQTYINGFISSLVHMDNPSKRDDENTAMHLQQLFASESERTSAFVIGDLNHFGGWFCRYCQQPEDIIAELHAESSSSRQVQFPAAERNHNIDVAYLQKLIANGIYVDGKTQLLRNRRYSDIYYAPAIAEKDTSKFGNLLVNLYETFDDDIEYEAGDY